MLFRHNIVSGCKIDSAIKMAVKQVLDARHIALWLT